jgi:hypothetical protein
LLQAQDQGYQSTLFVSAIQQKFQIHRQTTPSTASNMTYNQNQPVTLLKLHQGYLQLRSFYEQKSGKNERQVKFPREYLKLDYPNYHKKNIFATSKIFNL